MSIANIRISLPEYLCRASWALETCGMLCVKGAHCHDRFVVRPGRHGRRPDLLTKRECLAYSGFMSFVNAANLTSLSEHSTLTLLGQVRGHFFYFL
jgi:hypothetical protein